MTSLRFPDNGTRMAVGQSGAPAAGGTGVVYSDAALTTLAEIYTDVSGVKGPRNFSATLQLDTFGQQPDFWGPADGTDRLYVSVNGRTPGAAVDADYNSRIDAAVAIAIGALQKTAASVTDRTQWETFGLSTVGTTGRTTRTYYVATADCADVVAYWVGAVGDESATLTNSFSVKAALEIVTAPQAASGTVYPITFNGAATASVAPGQTLRSDPVSVNLRKGDGFYIRAYCSVTTPATDNFPLGRQHNASLFESSVTSSDLAYSSGVWAGSASFSCGPVRVEGVTSARTPTLAMIGSSTFEGIGDTQDTSSPGGGTYGWGWVRRLCAGNVGIVHLAKASETAQGFTPARYRARGPLVTACDYAIEGYGANDINNVRTLAQVQADKLRIWAALAARRCLVYTPTLHPTLTTSSDAYATTVNQTPAATNAVRIALNDWIRGGAPIDPTTRAAVAVATVGALVAGSTGHPLAGYLEVSDTVETARGSGIYKVGYTTDGQHLTSAACIAVVAALVSPFV